MPKKGSTKILDLPARVTMNERPLEGEGGRLVIHADDAEVRKSESGLRQVECIINAATDAAMEPFPELARDRAKRRFRIVVYDDGEAE